MEAIKTDELIAAKNFLTFNDLSTDANESSSMKQTIDNFVSESKGKLKGEVWDVISSQLGQFSSILTERIGLANRLSSAIQEALNLLIDYAGDEYTSLDCSQLPELEASRQRCKEKIDSINATIRSLSKNRNKDDTSTNNTSYYYGILNSYQNELVEIEKLIDKLRGLKEKYAEAQEILDNAFAEVTKVGNKISSISVGQIPTFIA